MLQETIVQLIKTLAPETFKLLGNAIKSTKDSEVQMVILAVLNENTMKEALLLNRILEQQSIDSKKLDVLLSR